MLIVDNFLTLAVSLARRPLHNLFVTYQYKIIQSIPLTYQKFKHSPRIFQIVFASFSECSWADPWQCVRYKPFDLRLFVIKRIRDLNETISNKISFEEMGNASCQSSVQIRVFNFDIILNVSKFFFSYLGQKGFSSWASCSPRERSVNRSSRRQIMAQR